MFWWTFFYGSYGVGLLGKMITLGLETVLVGDEGDRVELTVGSVPADGAADDQVLVLGASISDLGLFRPCDTVAGFVTANRVRPNQST